MTSKKLGISLLSLAASLVTTDLTLNRSSLPLLAPQSLSQQPAHMDPAVLEPHQEDSESATITVAR